MADVEKTKSQFMHPWGPGSGLVFRLSIELGTGRSLEPGIQDGPGHWNHRLKSPTQQTLVRIMHRGLAEGAGMSAVQSPFEVLNIQPILTKLLVEISFPLREKF